MSKGSFLVKTKDKRKTILSWNQQSSEFLGKQNNRVLKLQGVTAEDYTSGSSPDQDHNLF